MKTIKAEAFDRIFDEGEEDIMEYLDVSSKRRINRETRKINIEMPVWMLEALDQEAGRLSINRQAVIKTWLADKLEEKQSKRTA